MKDKAQRNTERLDRRHRRIRRKLSGTAERPRLVVYRSLMHVRAALVDDSTGRTLVQVSSTARDLPAPTGEGAAEGSAKMRRSLAVGGEVARRAREKGITRVAFDRGGRRFHGRVKAVADAARKGGLEF
jgi:large subunit ribosomal protein L18